MEPLKRTLESPYLHLVIGLLLFATSLADAWGTLATDLRHLHLTSHHSIGVFGLVYALKSLLEALEHGTRAAGEIRQTRGLAGNEGGEPSASV